LQKAARSIPQEWCSRKNFGEEICEARTGKEVHEAGVNWRCVEGLFADAGQMPKNLRHSAAELSTGEAQEMQRRRTDNRIKNASGKSRFLPSPIGYGSE
jgi:hypothetical protein